MGNVVAKKRLARIAALPLASASRPHGFLRGTAHTARGIWRSRELVWLLSRREVRARYKDSSLGMLWSLMRPLAQLAVYYFAIGKIMEVEKSIPGFALFVFIGLTGWTLYTEIVQKATSSIVTNSGLVKKVYLPREVFPLASAGAALFTFAIQMVILVAAFALSGNMPRTEDLPYAFLGFAVLAVIGVAVGLLGAALNVYMRDIEHLVEVAVIVFFWASPIVYSFAFVHRFLEPWMESVYLANPVTVAIIGLQRGLWVQGVNDPVAGVWPEHLGLLLVIALAVSLLLLLFAQRVFARLQGNFAQEV